MECTTCKWWAAWGCNNINWTTGKMSDPKAPVCGGLSYKVIPINKM